VIAVPVVASVMPRDVPLEITNWSLGIEIVTRPFSGMGLNVVKVRVATVAMLIVMTSRTTETLESWFGVSQVTKSD